MKKKARLVSFILAISLLFVSFSGFSSSNETTETETLEKTRDTKILCTATVDQDFDDSSVLVIMDNITGGINKQHELSFFGDIGATAIVDLTTLSSEILVASGLESSENVSKGVSETATISTSKSPWFEVNAETFRQILKIELSVHSKENVLNVIKKLEEIEGIKYAGPNYKVHLRSDFLVSTTSSIDNSHLYSWGIRKTGVMDAWNITDGSHDIKVGIIDSGIAEHPNLLDNLVSGANFYDNSGTGDTYGHGTEVAGVIGAVENNNLIIQGVCKNVSLIPLKVYTETVISETTGMRTINGNTDDIIQAIEYATNNGIHILNCSLGGYYYDAAEAQAIANYPGLFIASAGNDGNDNDDNGLYPSSYSEILTNVISVGASTVTPEGSATGTDEICTWSNYGVNSVDLFAPGFSIKTTYVYNGLYNLVYQAGTSYSAPHVAGAAALIMSVRPDMTPAEVKKCIMDSVDKSEDFEGKCVSGGRLNVYKAVQLATQPQTFTGDVNGDGRADMIITRRQSNGNRAIDTYLGQSDGTFGSVITTNRTQAYNYEDPVFIGDANGDGRTDLIVHSVVGGKRYLFIYRGNTDGTFTAAMLTATNDSHDYFTAKAKFFVADANGDGCDDFIVHTKNSSGKRINLTYLSEVAGSMAAFSTTASTFTSTNNYGIAPVYIGDFNGDGKADIVVPHTSNGKRCLLVYKGKSSAPYFSTGEKFTSSRNNDWLQWPCKEFISDVNGDGKDDLVVHWRSTDGKRNNLVYKGSSSGLKTEAVAMSDSTNSYDAFDEMFVGDINGDGYDDLLVQHADSNGKRNLLVYKGTSGGSYSTATNYVKNETLDLTVTPSCFFLADVTGEGRADFIVKYRDSSSGNVGFITYTGSSIGSFSIAKYSNVSSIPYSHN